MARRRYSGTFDTTLFLGTAALLIMGLFFLYSATYSRPGGHGNVILSKQALWMSIGILCLFAVTAIDYQRIIDVSYFLFAVNILLLVLLLFAGHSRLGAQRWFVIGGFSIQPSEFIKITLLLALATYIGHKRTLMHEVMSFIVPFVILSVPFALIILQPDLGTGLLLIPLLFALLFIGGARKKHLGIASCFGMLSVPFFWHFLRDYQKDRLLVFVNPNMDPLGAGYTIIQSKIAIGSGGLLGKGWLAGTQNQFNFLTERHTDFIFSVVGEEWGFAGAMVIVLLYLVIILRSFAILQSTNDMYGKLIVAGVISLLAAQVVVNIGMAIGLMPVVGLPLPLISYGGSSLITTLIAIGLVLNVGMRRSMF